MQHDKQNFSEKLLKASEEGKTAEVVELLERGADPNIQNIRGNTPIHLAAYHTNPQTTKLLLQYHANPNIQNIDGDTPLHLAAYHTNPQTTEVLLQHHANPNIQNIIGDTPLHLATLNNNPQTTEVLLQHNADPNIQDADGHTPIYYAITKHYHEIAEVIGKYTDMKKEDKELHNAIGTILRNNEDEHAHTLKDWARRAFEPENHVQHKTTKQRS